ncbi:mobilization protein BmgA [Bacteroides thetaiotaomicron]|uniref:Mobilization protein BmgA n=2 Tax=Bacteroidales TaxID=171549 RepID=Q8A312_BACTN|nr:relaxase/mobilization nuclease domain-containing protein [Bacteroides thetaiotaomicron]AAO78249.1 mobilization protein BmgA [Bacteroides thetaiotaomicron VPI-5482]MBI0304218.1 relaxase/mobilization nuclease domain-containing protein [Bacteroides thetaiotaomicron]MBM6523616.1 relaxase/mobilization nuclease domain-containing protein [Bacteroides thetaiotaomicron]MCS2627513.1 relaxase/mobilization nuclease domain-containing protein [Bacteroides thetaiotaomicron]MCS2825582.1 relaxase/mobilizati
MIGKLKKGSSFGGCIRYVTGKDEAKIIASDGVLLGTNAEITQSFELQRQLNPRIKKPVGHIALSFKPEDKPRLTDEFMTKIAIEYMQMMGITKTQFIIIRHHNADNPHCHIVYNRINNESKLISDRNDYRRNEQVTKALKSKYGLTYGTDKSNTNTRKLRNAERAKYEIHNAVKDALKMADSWEKLRSELAKRGVHLEFVYKDKAQTKVQGIRFCKDGYSFKGTQICREYSFGKLNAKFEGTENHVSTRANSAQQYEQGCRKNEQVPFMSENCQDPWDGISSIGLFASANAQTFESFPEDESAKKKKKKRRRGFSL